MKLNTVTPLDILTMHISMQQMWTERVAYALSQEELCVCEVAEIINSSVASASHHLRLLKNLRLAKSRKHGKMVYYSLQDECVKVIIGVALEHYKGYCET
ncbi:MAG: metalloregulator ArsR/SmtB family transcription factor [Clostridiales bacterium]|nr:metalloregulator ArsR/SmtB family transcription factor [Clostridiales bacterium]MCF8023000.1 metalloregulator ArsR/SmtB family transcription factor [Clostridiales bacterium]